MVEYPPNRIFVSLFFNYSSLSPFSILLLFLFCCYLPKWSHDDPCPFMFKSVLLSMSKFVKCPFTLIGWLLGDLVHFVPCSFMSKIAVLLNPRANHTANMSADFFGQRRRALGQQAPSRSGLLLLFNLIIN